MPKEKTKLSLPCIYLQITNSLGALDFDLDYVKVYIYKLLGVKKQGFKLD